MKKSLLGLLFLLLAFKTIGQNTSADLEVMHNIQYFRSATVSFGMDTLVTFQDIEGKLIRKRIFASIGTGVMFYVKIKDKIRACIVTAKHVLRDTLTGWKPKTLNIRFPNKDTLPIDSYFGEVYKLYGDKNLPTWFEHPDSTIDLAAIVPFEIKDTSIMSVLSYWILPNDDEYYEGKEVFVLGYPNAVGLDLLNKAILRRGIISWVPSDINQSGKKILIDCNIFPGNSGGPVFSIPKNFGVMLDDTVLLKPKFYGIVSQRRVSNNNLFSKGGKILDSLGNPITSIESIGIGVIITAKKVRELLNYVQGEFDKWVKEEEIEKKNKKN